MSRRIVTRQDIQRMSTNETDRFFDAVDTMMRNKTGPGTSEFFRLASIHGQPAPIYCEHGRETFPGWHRIYLMEFEEALQAADMQNGRDGNIALPYWDWTTDQSLPQVQRFRWPSKDFWPRHLNASFPRSLIRARNSQIRSQIRSWGVPRAAQESLLNSEHWRHASTQFRSMYPSLEDPHNDIHVIVGGQGGQLSSVAWAAFDIVFWLHHCNVDRIYESYLAIEPDSLREFEQFQRRQTGTNLFQHSLEPFRKPNSAPYTAADTFNTRRLGYVYDGLMRAPPQRLREPPVLLMFTNVKISNFESKCYQVHVFIYDKREFKDEQKDSIQTIEDLNAYYESDNYAGGVGVFGRGMECQTCASSPPRNIIIDISKTIKKLKISRYNAVPKVYVLETTSDSNKLKSIGETPLPTPIITGPLFDSTGNSDMYDKKHRKGQSKEAVMALQKYLKHFGYYDKDDMDGDFDDMTEMAVKDFQKATGMLKIDGKVGPKTRDRIINMKRCDNKDGFANNQVTDTESDYEESQYRGKYSFTYSVGIPPGYLQKEAVQNCIRKVCDEYTQKSENILRFTEVENSEQKADIAFNWKRFQDEDDVLKWDGPGGILGKGGNGFVEFDVAERWVIGLSENDEKELSDIQDVTTWRRGKPTISLYYTALHELGHTLGLDHSINVSDVMSPWYNPKQTGLSVNDSLRLMQVAVFGQKAPGSQVKLGAVNEEQKEEIVEQRLLFLDIDGVLNHSMSLPRTLNAACLLRLERIIDETDCSIVLSSSWRRVDELKNKFKKEFNKVTSLDIEDVYAGDTPSNGRNPTRVHEVMEYFEKNELDHVHLHWCIVDDMDLVNEDPGFSRQCQKFLNGRWVQTSIETGLSEENVEQIVSILNEDLRAV